MVRRIWKLALPLSLAHLGQVIMGLVDTAFVGRLETGGADALAAVALGNSLFFMVTIPGMGAVAGIEPLVAQAHGARDPQRARIALFRGLIIALLGCIPLGLAVLAMIAGMDHFGVAPSVIPQARDYLWARLPGLPALMLFFAFKSYLQGTDRVRPILVATVIMNVINIPADYLLIFGHGGPLPWAIPGLGVFGAGLASSLSSWVRAGLLLFVVRTALGEENASTPRAPAENGASPSAWEFAGLLRVLRVGMPIGLALGVEVGVFSFVSILMGQISNLALAAHQIAINLASGSFNLVVGVGSATGILVGQEIGAGRPAGARRAGFSGLLVGMGLMGAFAVFFFFLARPLAAAFTEDQAVIQAAASLLMVAAFFQLSDGLQAVAQGALRGAGDTAIPFVLQAISHWAIGLPLGLILAHPLGLGATGLWWGLTAGLTVAALSLVLRFAHKSRVGFSALEGDAPIDESEPNDGLKPPA
jgi:MATE family multidrug resistance protein